MFVYKEVLFVIMHIHVTCIQSHKGSKQEGDSAVCGGVMTLMLLAILAQQVIMSERFLQDQLLQLLFDILLLQLLFSFFYQMLRSHLVVRNKSGILSFCQFVAHFPAPTKLSLHERTVGLRSRRCCLAIMFTHVGDVYSIMAIITLLFA